MSRPTPETRPDRDAGSRPISPKAMGRLLGLARNAPDAPAIHLVIESGARKGETVELPPGGTYRLGRKAACDILFDPHGDPLVSAEHALLAVEEDRATVRDLGSKNGTFVNGEAVQTETTLRDGDRIELARHGPALRIRFPAN